MKCTHTAGVALAVAGCVLVSTIQISNELLTFLAVKPNDWPQKTQPCKRNKRGRVSTGGR